MQNFCFMFCYGRGIWKNIETTEFRYFNKAELPELATEQNTKEQIEMCFNAYYNKNWIAEFDWKKDRYAI